MALVLRSAARPNLSRQEPFRCRYANIANTQNELASDNIFSLMTYTENIKFLNRGHLYLSRDICIFLKVDGEACRLLPSIINMSLLNKATMLAKRRSSGKPHQDVAKLERLKLPVMKIKMSDYESFHSDKERLKKSAIPWLMDPLDLDATMDLESLRKLLAKDHSMESCCFLDCKDP